MASFFQFPGENIPTAQTKINTGKIKPDFVNLTSHHQKWKSWIAINFDKYGLGNPQKVGYMILWVSKNKPANLQDFWNKWTKKDTNKLRFLKVLNELKRILPDETEDTLVQVLFIGLFYNTYVGYAGERFIMDNFNKKYPDYVVEHTDKKIDKTYAIDLFATNLEENKRIGIQVKTTNWLNPKWMGNYKAKIARFEKEFKLPVMYIHNTYTYNSDTFDFDIKIKTVTFDIEELYKD